LPPGIVWRQLVQRDRPHGLIVQLYASRASARSTDYECRWIGAVGAFFGRRAVAEKMVSPTTKKGGVVPIQWGAIASFASWSPAARQQCHKCGRRLRPGPADRLCPMNVGVGAVLRTDVACFRHNGVVALRSERTANLPDPESQWDRRDIGRAGFSTDRGSTR